MQQKPDAMFMLTDQQIQKIKPLIERLYLCPANKPDVIVAWVYVRSVEESFLCVKYLDNEHGLRIKQELEIDHAA